MAVLTNLRKPRIKESMPLENANYQNTAFTDISFTEQRQTIKVGGKGRITK